MTEQKRKSLANKIIKDHQYDEQIKENYNRYWKKYSIIYSIVAVVYFAFYSILHESCGPYDYADWLFGTMFINLIVTLVMLSFAFMGAKFYLSNGQKYNSIKGTLMKMLCFFDCMVPIMYIVYYFVYNPDIDAAELPIWKIMLYAPLAFGAMVLGGAFMGTTAPYSQGTDKMTKADWRMMRQEQELAGLDPDKMPITLSPEKIKGMTKADWHQLGMDLELAGYDVFKK